MWENDQSMKLKVGLAEMLKGGVIMDVTSAEQARIAEEAGAVAAMALERVPADIRKEGGVARMASIKIIKETMNAVTIPVMAKARIGHFEEAQVLEAVGVVSLRRGKFCRRLIKNIRFTRNPLKFPSFAGAATWAKPCAGLARARR